MSAAISVLTPVYNGASFLPRSYALLRAQTLTDWEWVVVDDGSTDGTAGVLAAIADPRLSRVTFAANRGRGAARSAGLAAATGRWVAIWDVDDVYFPDRLARIARAAAEGFDFLCSYAAVIDNHLRLRGVRGFHSPSRTFPRYFVHPTLAVRTDLARAIGYPPELRAGEDAELVLTLAARHRGCFVEDALAAYQEEREVSVDKAIQSNRSQLRSIRRLVAAGVLPGGAAARVRFSLLWPAKIAALHLLRLAPGLYRRTLARRDNGAVVPGFALAPERIAFLEALRRGGPTTLAASAAASPHDSPNGGPA